MTIRDIAVSFGFDVDQKSVSAAENAVTNLKNKATKLLSALGIGFSIAQLSKFANECVDIASDVSEMESKFEVVFGKMSDEVDAWATEYADSIGRSKSAIKTYLADQQNLLVGFTDGSEGARAEAAKLSEEMTSLALDIASFANTDEDVAVERMTKAVMGESEAAKGLGAVLNEVTRAEAMQRMGLQGSYDALDQYTKMQVNLNAIQYQSKDAIGDCINSMDRYESKTRQLAARQKDLKEFIGKQLIPAFSVLKSVQIKFVEVATKVAKAVLGETEEDNRLLKVMDGIHSLVKRLQPAFDRLGQAISNGMSRAHGFIQNVADKLGGMDNLLKILAIAAAAFIAIMSWNSIVKGAQALMAVLSKIGTYLGVFNIKTLKLIAVIVVLALIVEDFIHFLLGNDSLLGTIFDEAGIGADNAREAIFNAWNTIKNFLLGVYDTIKQAAKMFTDTVKNFFERHSESVRENLERAWGIISDFLSGVWTFITELASTLFGDTEDSIDGSTQSTKDKVLGIWQTILDTMTAIWDALYQAADSIFNALATVIETVFDWIQAFWNAWGSDILSWFKTVWDSMGGVLNGFLDIIKGIADFVSSVFTGDWNGAWEAIKEIFSGVWQVIVSILTAVWETIKLLFSMGLSAVKSVWETVWSAIKGFFQGIWTGIVSFLQSIWGTIKGAVSGGISGAYNAVVSGLSAIRAFFINAFSTIASSVSTAFTNIKNGISSKISTIKTAIVNGFQSAIAYIKSLPSQAVKWGSDIVSGIASGIRGAISKVTSAVSGIASKIRSYLHFSVPDVGPLTDFQSWMPDFMQGLAKGIEGSEDKVLDKVKGLAGSISTLMQAATANPATAKTGAVSNSTSNVTQNVNISNSYSGGSTETQRNVSKAMNKSAVDATTQMARSLAYARG